MMFDIIFILVIYTYIIGADNKYLVVEIPKESSPTLSDSGSFQEELSEWSTYYKRSIHNEKVDNTR